MSVTSIDDHRNRKPPKPDVPREGGGMDRPYPIDVTSGDLPRMAKAAWAAMEAQNDPPQWFRVGRIAVRLVADVEGKTMTPEQLTVDSLFGISARSAYWYKDKKDGPVPQFPVERVIRDMLADASPVLPLLKRIVYAPVFSTTGHLSVTPGYNHETNNYYAAGSLNVEPPADQPTPAEVSAAKSLLLDDFLGDFPFATDADRAHALCLLLNPFVRDLIDGTTPLHMIEAPSAGTGKGLLARMAMLPALGTSPTQLSPVGNQDEFRKSLSSTLFAIPEAIMIDNVPDGLDSPYLASALTEPQWTGRVLGKSLDRTVDVRATWMATGNNPSKSREMARRMVTIRLDSRTERPEERRGFRHRLLERWARDNRARLVHAALTVVQAWVAAGMPAGTDVLGSYDRWAEVHGGILAVIGQPGFLANRNDNDAVTVSDDASWASFVDLWWESFRDRDVTASDLFSLLKHVPDFPLAGNNDRAVATSFGSGLRRHRDRIFNYRQITFTGTVRHAATYRLISTEQVPF